MPATLRRRRRKKNATINRQDADLEKEVDSYLNWGHEEPTTRKRQKKRAYGGSCNDASTEKASNIKAKGNSRALPILLHLREIRGQSQRFLDNNGRSSWETLMLQQTGSTISSYSEKEGGDSSKYPSQWRTLQYSCPTYYDILHNDNTSKNGNIKMHRKFWRPYSQQSIPFSKLKTPFQESQI